nr:MbtH domain protein [Nostoc sp. B(2019)]
HPIRVGLLPERTSESLEKRISDNYVHIEFTNTKGGTVLGIDIDQDATKLTEGDFVAGSGVIYLVGSLMLDFEKVRCFAEIDLATLDGEGYLELLD